MRGQEEISQLNQARAILNFSVNAKQSVNRKIKKWGQCRGQDYLKVQEGDTRVRTFLK